MPRRILRLASRSARAAGALGSRRRAARAVSAAGRAEPFDNELPSWWHWPHHPEPAQTTYAAAVPPWEN